MCVSEKSLKIFKIGLCHVLRGHHRNTVRLQKSAFCLQPPLQTYRPRSSRIESAYFFKTSPSPAHVLPKCRQFRYLSVIQLLCFSLLIFRISIQPALEHARVIKWPLILTTLQQVNRLEFKDQGRQWSKYYKPFILLFSFITSPTLTS